MARALPGSRVVAAATALLDRGWGKPTATAAAVFAFVGHYFAIVGHRPVATGRLSAWFEPRAPLRRQMQGGAITRAAGCQTTLSTHYARLAMGGLSWSSDAGSPLLCCGSAF